MSELQMECEDRDRTSLSFLFFLAAGSHSRAGHLVSLLWSRDRRLPVSGDTDPDSTVTGPTRAAAAGPRVALYEGQTPPLQGFAPVKPPQVAPCPSSLHPITSLPFPALHREVSAGRGEFLRKPRGAIGKKKGEKSILRCRRKKQLWGRIGRVPWEATRSLRDPGEEEG